MGRHATKDARTTLALDPEIKQRAVVYALLHGKTLQNVINEALRAYLNVRKVPQKIG
jgi:hypothetical protein